MSEIEFDQSDGFGFVVLSLFTKRTSEAGEPVNTEKLISKEIFPMKKPC
jgi:hypothetical protein